MSHNIDKKLINKSEIARRVGLSQPYVSQILNGTRKGPKAQAHIKRIEKEIRTLKYAA